MQTLQQTLIQTPWWVYVLFIFVVYRGFRAAHTSVISIRRLFIIPVLLILVSGHTLLTLASWTLGLIATLLLTLLMGAVLGWVLAKAAQIKVDHKNQLMQLKGSWSTLVLILIIFASKYYIGYETGAHPDMVTHPSFIYTVFVILGLIIGILVGRLLHYLYVYKTSVSTDLASTS